MNKRNGRKGKGKGAKRRKEKRGEGRRRKRGGWERAKKKKRERGGVGREEGQGRELKEGGKRREAPENRRKPRSFFTKCLTLRGFCIHPMPYLAQIGHVSAGVWYTRARQIS